MKKVPVVVVYKKPKGRKHFIKVLDTTIDEILDSNKRKPFIPYEFELIEIGWGEPFIEKYMDEYNIIKIEEND